MVNSAFVNVGRWSALAFGLVYGYSHNASLQKQAEEKKRQLEYKHKEQLIEEAKRAYAAKKNPVAVVDVVSVDIESPDFDVEKYIAQLEKQEAK
ncbi:hypothetical protein O0I10_008800 [Lichtheimia ornata]|uniref:ATP synthase F(0) complex subunit e, mitochondrial n=1 Tax=Lichtheimia ornata TaxID=688661 RepID=A0AAD7UYY0_9FUNG|nr:uncharacterized protein O0I10_008800 [Lichtheimia ornata]KAJ8655514.1 hypothetical protein O0I10_008800 [Lichtheimia ornata]